MLKQGMPPVHPGEILREMFIRERNLTITEVAKGLNIARTNLSAIINKHAGISPELAVKLSEAFGNTAQFWINLQKNYELWHAERKVKRSGIRHFIATNQTTNF
ncbi:MAG: HigA family addiction module antitoxin [Segetibacter sp.]